MDNINVTPEFILAGEATFTVSNGVDNHYTYHVYDAPPSVEHPHRTWFIKVLVGQDNTAFVDYAYIGLVNLTPGPIQRGTRHAVNTTARSKFRLDSPQVKVAEWALRAIWQAKHNGYKLPPGYSIKHIGRCGRCGAALTNPASLDSGLGPECAAQLGVEWAERDQRQASLI